MTPFHGFRVRGARICEDILSEPFPHKGSTGSHNLKIEIRIFKDVDYRVSGNAEFNLHTDYTNFSCGSENREKEGEISDTPLGMNYCKITLEFRN